MAREDLTHRLTFQKRALSSDGHGNTHGTWAAQFTVWAGVKFMRGGETFTAQRLEAEQPAIIKIRASSDPDQLIRAHWRAVEGDQVFKITERPVLTKDRLWFEMMAVAVDGESASI